MAEVTLRKPHHRDIAELGTRMRPADVAELAACDHFDPLKVVERSVNASPICYAALCDGEVLCIFGVAPLRPYLLLEDRGAPWLLATPAFERHSRSLIALTPAYIQQMLGAYPKLENFVHAENLRAVRWLRRLGFTLAPAAPYGPNGAPFHRFEMTRHV